MHLGMWLGQDDQVKLQQSIRMGTKGVLSDFEHGLVVGARRACLSIISSRYPVSGSSLCENALLMQEVREEWPDHLWAHMSNFAEAQITGDWGYNSLKLTKICNNWVMQSCQNGPKSLRNVSSTFLSLCHKEWTQYWQQNEFWPGTSKMHLKMLPVSVNVKPTREVQLLTS